MTVQLSRHAIQRARQRLGLNKKALANKCQKLFQKKLEHKPSREDPNKFYIDTQRHRFIFSHIKPQTVRLLTVIYLDSIFESKFEAYIQGEKQQIQKYKSKDKK